MSSINDWAAKCAERVVTEFDDEWTAGKRWRAQERVAAIIATFAKPMLDLLNEARREHSRGYNDEGCDYPPCPKSQEENDDEKCTCQADAWNARIDAAIGGNPLKP